MKQNKEMLIKMERLGVKLRAFPSLLLSFLSDEVTKQGLAMYINGGTARDFLHTPSLETAWPTAEEDFTVIKESDDTLPPFRPQQLDSWVASLVNKSI